MASVRSKCKNDNKLVVSFSQEQLNNQLKAVKLKTAFFIPAIYEKLPSIYKVLN